MKKLKKRLPHWPGPDGGPDENVSAFVALGRSSKNLGADLAFEASRWEVTDHVRRRRGVPARQGRLYLNYEPPGVRAAGGAPSPMGLFMRAFVRQLPGRTGFSTLVMYTLAGRLISEAMASLGVDEVSGCTPAVLDRAMELARAKGGAGYQRHLRTSARQIAAFLGTAGMARASLAGWQPPMDRQGIPARNDAESGARSARLLPSEEFLEALATAYRLADAPADILVTRVAVLLAAAPERINELLALGVDPEVERSADGASALGLRWSGSKGFPDGVKWIPSALAPTVRESLSDLRRVTAEGRRIKSWYNQNPHALYLPLPLEHLRGRARLTINEVGALLGREPRCSLHGHVRRAALEQLPPVGILTGAAHNLTFAEVERLILRRLPDSMRDCGGPRTEPLLIVPLGTFRPTKRSVCPCMFEPVRYAHIAHGLKQEGGHSTVFQRLGMDPDGTIGARTHALRHWVNTLAKRGGLSDADTATWSGRVDPRQTRHYDHRTAEEMRELAARGNARSWRTTSPLARQGRAGPAAAHPTGDSPAPPAGGRHAP